MFSFRKNQSTDSFAWFACNQEVTRQGRQTGKQASKHAGIQAGLEAGRQASRADKAADMQAEANRRLGEAQSVL